MCITTGCEDTASTTNTETDPIGTTPSYQIVVNPLSVQYHYWDYHLIQWFPEGSTYESIEMMVANVASDNPLIWVFLTESIAPKMQHHYVNDASLLPLAHEGISDSTGVIVPITFNIAVAPYDLRVFDVSFNDESGTPINWHFESNQPLSTANGDRLIDQDGVDLDRGILVMYANESALSGEHSEVQIGDARFAPPYWDEISSPPFFEAWRGACTHGMSFGFIAAGSASYTFTQYPENPFVNATWRGTYQWENDTETPFEWIVTDIDDTGIHIASGDLRMTLVENENRLDILTTGAATGEGYTNVAFTPALRDPRAMTTAESQTVAFSIDIDNHLDQITGTATLTRQADHATLLLAPQTPGWAVNNLMHTIINTGNGTCSTTSVTIQQ